VTPRLACVLIALLFGPSLLALSPSVLAQTPNDSTKDSAATGPAAPDSAAVSPLPPCPGSPNCEHVTRAYPLAADSLFQAATQALTAIDPISVETEADDRRARAVYRVALIFKDDVWVAVTPGDDRSHLHIRSASRVGYSDLGVNARRVQNFFEALDALLAERGEALDRGSSL